MASKDEAVPSTSSGRKKYKALSVAEKLKVIEAHESGVSRGQLMTQYDLKKSTLHDILKNKERTRKVMNTVEGGTTGEDIYRSRKLQHDNLDDAVYKWYTREHAEDAPVRWIEIKHAAERLAAHLGIEDFKCSDGWLGRFRTRHGIVKSGLKTLSVAPECSAYSSTASQDFSLSHFLETFGKQQANDEETTSQSEPKDTDLTANVELLTGDTATQSIPLSLLASQALQSIALSQQQALQAPQSIALSQQLPSQATQSIALSQQLPSQATQSIALSQQLPSHSDTDNKMTTLSHLVREVRELYLSKVYPKKSPLTCNAMSPRVILIKPTPQYIEKHIMGGLVKNEPLSEDEESWDSNWDGREWDMNVLEPLVEISDNPQDKGRKRRRPNSGEGRKRTRLPSGNQDNGGENHVGTVTGSEFVNVTVKIEPGAIVPEPVEDMPLTAPMASIPVAKSSSTQPHPVYKMHSGNMTVFLPQAPSQSVMQNPGNYADQNTNISISQQESRDSPGTSKKPTEEINLVANVKQEKEDEMDSVFVMSFGGTLENEDKTASEKQPSPEPEIIECDSEGETTRKNRTAAIAESLGGSGTPSSRNLRELTFKLVELNNKNLQCDSRIEKIKEEFRKRLKIVELEKGSIEHQIDRVLASIQDWKEKRKK